MKRNPVQFQKGLSLNEFLEHYGDEDKCHVGVCPDFFTESRIEP